MIGVNVMIIGESRENSLVTCQNVPCERLKVWWISDFDIFKSMKKHICSIPSSEAKKQERSTL